jgi:hypothetical protein
LHSASRARAEKRALVDAAALGSVLGLTLGAFYLCAGLSQAAAERGAVHVPLGPAAFSTIAAADDVSAQLRGSQGLDPEALHIVAARPTRARELECLTEAVYFEARGESARGQQAVATVIMNRVKNPNFPKTVCGVVYQGAAHRNGCQFSFACDGMAERVVEHTAWTRARGVAARVLSGAVLREVGSATHFHATQVDPSWGSQMLRVAQVGLHVFYRFNPHAPRPAILDRDDEGVDFVSAPAQPEPPTLRLAQALVVPTPPPAPVPVSDAKPAAPIAEAKPPAPAVEVKPLAIPPAGVAKTDAPVAAKPVTVATAS